MRYIGASSGPAWQMMKALSLSERNGWARFVTMQNHYNLLYREEEREMIPLCVAEGIGVIPWSPLARGLLARAEMPDKRPVDEGSTSRAATDTISPRLYDTPEDADVVAAVRRVSQARGITPAEVSLAWLLSRPAIVAPIVGATKPEHLDAAVRALDVSLSTEELAMLETPYGRTPSKGTDRLAFVSEGDDHSRPNCCRRPRAAATRFALLVSSRNEPLSFRAQRGIAGIPIEGCHSEHSEESQASR